MFNDHRRERAAFLINTPSLTPWYHAGMEENPYKAPTEVVACPPKQRNRNVPLGIIAVVIGMGCIMPLVPKLVAWLCTIGIP